MGMGRTTLAVVRSNENLRADVAISVMPLDDDNCYRAIRARDSRFDGRFFVAVSSTRVYCRPICMARLPKRENCRFFSNIDEAEAAGYRACLKCRPRLFSAGAPDDALKYRTVRRKVPADVGVFELPFRPPYDWDAMLAFLSARAVSGVEEIAGRSYRRTVRVSHDGIDHLGWCDVSPVEGKDAVRVTISASLSKVIPSVLGRVRRLMDLAANVTEISGMLGKLATPNPGLRLPGAFDGFEIGVRAILGQQVTVAAARTVAGRFAAAFGTAIESPYPSIRTVFPAPQKVAKLIVDHIARLGILAARSRSIIALARAIADGEIKLDRSIDVASELNKLRALPGIGEWTAQYIAMRALNWPDAFPHTDYGIMKALGEKNPKRVLEISEEWRPWRSYAVIHLWQSLHQQSFLPKGEGGAPRAG
jgi:AraC family transcriptional regulator of adaptative response / DNA-3-methyladenine glycosylase II